MNKRILFMMISVFCLLNASFGQSVQKKMELLKDASFKMEIGGKKTALYTLNNKNGMIVQLTNYGARVVALFVKDKNQQF